MRSEDAGGWIVNRLQVRLVGRVTAGDGTVASGGLLSLTPAEGTRKSRGFETSIRSDGFYFFLDVPAGGYLLNGKDESGNGIESVRVQIPVPRGRSLLDVVAADLTASKQTAAGEETTRAKVSTAPARRRRGSRGAAAGDPHA